MIVMKSVRGPSIYDYTNGYDITIGELEEIHVSSGKMVLAQAVSSSEFLLRPDSVSGNILTIKAFNPSNASVGFVALATSANLSSVDIVVIADGY